MSDDRGCILRAWARTEQKLDPSPGRAAALAESLKPQIDAIEAALPRLPFESEPAGFLATLAALKAKP